jgi:hypothetical protein
LTQFKVDHLPPAQALEHDGFFVKEIHLIRKRVRFKMALGQKSATLEKQVMEAL